MNYILCPHCGWCAARDLLDGVSTVPHIVCPCGYDNNNFTCVISTETAPKFATENADYDKEEE